MDTETLISEIKKTLELDTGLVDGPLYSMSHKQLGQLYYNKGQQLAAVYHFCESHAASFRQIGVYLATRTDLIGNEKFNKISFSSSYAVKGPEGMLSRLEEMPQEWRLIQLTRAFDPAEIISIREPNKSPMFKELFLTHLPCGTALKHTVPVCRMVTWEYESINPVENFLNMKKKLGSKQGSHSQIRKMRNEASSEIEKDCRELGPMLFKEWIVLMLGRLCFRSLEKEIREAVDKRIGITEVSAHQRHLCYLLAEGCCHLENAELEVALYHVFPEDEKFAVKILESLVRIKEDLGPRLHVAARHPVLLILDDHLDVISWESFSILRRHPVCRVYSLHIAHMLYTVHKDHIKGGVREIEECELCYYIVNPDGDLPTVENTIRKFFQKRFPNWHGIIGKKPSEEELTKALTESNTYIYCGHGSGSQYLKSGVIQQLNVKPVQMLFGCASVQLRDQGGSTDMYGDVMEYALASSGCTLGMLWPVMTGDTDKITMTMANLFLPGNPIDIITLEEVEGSRIRKEPDLLRALRDVRQCVDLFSNGAAIIVRGIPIKLVPTLKV